MMNKLRIADFAEVITGGTPSTAVREYWDNGDIPWLQSGACQNCVIEECDTFITQSGLDNSSAKLMKPDSVLIALTGATTGKVGYLTFPACANQSVTGIQPNNRFIPKYLYYYLLGIRQKILHDSYGGAQKHISQGYVKNIEVPLVDIEKQKKIATALDKANSIITNRQLQLNALDTLIKARFIEMFGDINTNSKNWLSLPLGELCTIVRGGSPRPIEQFLGGDVPWIKIGDATEGESIYLTTTKEHIIQEGVKKSRLVKAGSLIFANCGVSLGFARIITFDGCIHDGWLAMEDIDRRLDKVFLLQALNQMTEHFREMAPAGTQPNLNTAIMKSYMQIIPPIKLQEEYIKFVSQVDKSKVAVQQALDKAQLLFDSMMQTYFK